MGADLRTRSIRPILALLGLSLALLAGCSGLQRPVEAQAAPRTVPAAAHEVSFEAQAASVSATSGPRSETQWADFYYLKGDFKRSIALLSDAVAKDEGNATLWRNLGSSYAQDDDFDNAVLCFQRALKRNPSDTKSCYDLSVVQGWKGNLAQAESAAKAGLALEPRHGGLHSSLGNVYDDEGHEDQALQEYATALAVNPKDTVTRFNRGGLYLKLNQLAPAEADFDKVLKIAPHDLEAAQNLAAVYILQNRLPAAERLNAWVVQQHPKDDDTLENAYFNLGIIYDRENKVEHALNMYQLALQEAPWDAAAYVNAAVILERLNRRNEALAYWQKYQRLFPASRRAADIDKRIQILTKMVALDKANAAGSKSVAQ
ncbi:MAG TPA: tetratricopeptide repeat protein [bacterium]|jgi:tetratricopeptide (TPR) repeat protein|nr:tetratricopeptide repeat protein [bacterium]